LSPIGLGSWRFASIDDVFTLRRHDRVQLSIVALNFVYAALGVVLMYVSYRVIDRLTPEVDFPAELKNGNVAVAIFIAALFISIALIIGRALN
jgi:putative membrane protein